MSTDARPPELISPTADSPRLSYKFQRLRERIRAAIESGELRGRLPGERTLGRRFGANAKTINKALADLSRDGLVMRVIGRGTFVTDGNGRAAGGQSARRFRVLMPADSSAAPHRRRLMDAFCETLRRDGHDVAMTPCNGDGDVERAAWPSAARRHDAGVICFPDDPLSRRAGRFSGALTAEILRRQTPCVVIGATPDTARLPAVMPDFVDAGFRLAEHLLLGGCESIMALLSTAGSRESEQVVSGCCAAARRYEYTMTRVVLEGADRRSFIPDQHGAGPAAQSSGNSGGMKRRIGLVCIGRDALETVINDAVARRMMTEGALHLACMLEPGDDSAERENVTSYDLAPQCLAQWAARLLIESRPGQRPAEIIVPGTVNVRGLRPARSPAGRGNGRDARPDLGAGNGRDADNGRRVERKPNRLDELAPLRI